MATFETKFTHGDPVFIIAADDPGRDCNEGLWAFGPYKVGDIELHQFSEGTRVLYHLSGLPDDDGKVWAARCARGWEADLFATREETQKEADRRWNASLRRKMR